MQKIKNNQVKEKTKLNNKGFSKKETMICLLLIIIGIVAVLYFTTEADDSTNFSKFIRLSKEFGEEAGVVRDSEGSVYENRVFLYDVIALGYDDKYTSPFDSSKQCDIYESKIEMEGKSIYITMQCSEYLIYKEVSTSEVFTIYKVSKWTDERLSGSHVQTTTFYNYEIDGVEQFDTYFSEKEFLVKYNEKEGTNTFFTTNLKSGHNILKKTYYRTMEQVA